MRSLSLMIFAAALLSAQPSSVNRVVYVSVTDPVSRFVAGLNQENFEIVENGTRRSITGFASSDSPISIALVSEEPIPTPSWVTGSESEFIQTQSVSDAVRRLGESKNARKVIVATVATLTEQIPEGVTVLRADSATAERVIVEARNKYLIQFRSLVPAGTIDVILKQPHGLPPLKSYWK